MAPHYGETIRFRGALYRKATLPNKELWDKRKELHALVSSLGVLSLHEEQALGSAPRPPFIPLSDGRSFLQLLQELNNRAILAGAGETPASYDFSAEELKKGIDEALTGKLTPTLKRIRQLFDELKQHPGILMPRTGPDPGRLPAGALEPFRVKEAPRFLPETEKRRKREEEIRKQQEFLKRDKSPVPASVQYRGARYRLALIDIVPLKHAFRDEVYGESARIIRRIIDALSRFRIRFDEQALAEAEGLATRLVEVAQTGVLLLGRIMTQEKEFRPEAAQLKTRNEELLKIRRRRKLEEDVRRLKKMELLPAELDIANMSDDQIDDLLIEPLDEETDMKERERRRRLNFGLPPKKRKIWKDRPEPEPIPEPVAEQVTKPTPVREVQKKSPRGRRRLVTPLRVP